MEARHLQWLAAGGGIEFGVIFELLSPTTTRRPYPAENGAI